MKTTLTVALLLAACAMAFGQATPSATSGGSYFQYSAHYSEAAQFGGELGNWHTVTPSASLSYANGRKRFPFSLEYAGGYTATPSGPRYTSGFFQHLYISQEIGRGKWKIGLSDDVSYRPQSPTTGFSGIPGIGEPIGGGTNGPGSQFILAVNTHALENVAHADIRQILSPNVILNLSASNDFLHFPDQNGLDTASITVIGGLDFRLDPRDSLTSQYAFSEFTYSGYDLHIQTNTGTVGLKKTWNRSLFMSAAAGPEWLSSSNATVIPGSIDLSAVAQLGYQRRKTSIALSYSRGTSPGSGYMIGAESSVVSVGLSRQFTRPLRLESSFGYSRNSALAPQWHASGVFGGIQASRGIGRNLSAFINYTAASQSSTNQVPTNVLNEMMQTLSFGLTYSKETKATR